MSLNSFCFIFLFKLIALNFHFDTSSFETWGMAIMAWGKLMFFWGSESAVPAKGNEEVVTELWIATKESHRWLAGVRFLLQAACSVCFFQHFFTRFSTQSQIWYRYDSSLFCSFTSVSITQMVKVLYSTPKSPSQLICHKNINNNAIHSTTQKVLYIHNMYNFWLKDQEKSLRKS